MYAHSVGIHVWKRLQVFHALHLVLHLYLSQLSEGSLLESLATVLTASVIEDEEQKALLCHVGLPATAAIVPTGIHVVGMRSTIYIYNSRVLLVRVEVDRLHHSPVEVGLAVGSLDGTATVLWHVVTLPWVLGGEVRSAVAYLHVDDGYLARYGWSGVVVVEILSALAQCSVVPTFAVVIHHGTLSCLCIYQEDIALDRRALVASDDDALVLRIEAEHIHYYPLATGELLHLYG